MRGGEIVMMEETPLQKPRYFCRSFLCPSITFAFSSGIKCLISVNTFTIKTIAPYKNHTYTHKFN